MSQEPGEPGNVMLRDTGPGDDQFLFKLYASTREEEMAPWGWGAAQKEMFLRMQFQAWQHGLVADALKTTDSIILRDGERIGRIVVVRSSSEICLADIALLPNHRGAGIGATLIGELQAEAAAGSLPLRLQVVRDNRAARLYHRLGFAVIGDSGFHFKMEWLPR